MPRCLAGSLAGQRNVWRPRVVAIPAFSHGPFAQRAIRVGSAVIGPTVANPQLSLSAKAGDPVRRGLSAPSPRPRSIGAPGHVFAFDAAAMSPRGAPKLERRLQPGPRQRVAGLVSPYHVHRWQNHPAMVTLARRGCDARPEPTYPRGLIDPLGNCPWPGPWTWTYGAHLLS